MRRCDRTTQSRKPDVVCWKNERDTGKDKRNHQRRNYLRISQSRQGEIPAVVLLDGAGHNSFLDFVRLTEYNVPTNDMEVCYV